ncbi:Nut1p NDAI_0H03400 [Naumovozyma dairenensis CBS 421]|uniref:Mediator of RNA polymerase II transcription subunit 5 n=1 Tax=Naumovozyma dairenensis (strain ATCC 10597 / BCRC 20456 / CBS 421 / NBRC 0211 / NRRL Y-12639) TaxID=1071378 RepID=G0WFF2_NAUDC|nr:hypothetical protein NDAI_0H03400 [Naumovozyma dairenensis CBS 421]CCD26513.1 hypothetical protein NDAI_0H03400 [Naumovozyma dairenensis CBS 421]
MSVGSMSSAIEKQSVFDLAIKCADKQIPANEFLNLFNEFYNEKFLSKVENVDEDAQNDSANLGEISEALSSDFVNLLNSGNSFLIADYIAHLLFVNYNTNLVQRSLSKLDLITNTDMLIHFFSKASMFFSSLSDKLVQDQLCKDLPDIIIPSILSMNMKEIPKGLLVSITKLLQVLLRFITTPVPITAPNSRDNSRQLMSRLSHTNKLLYKKLSQTLESKLVFKELRAPSFVKDNIHDFATSPSLTSPQFISSPLSMMKTPMSTSSGAKYKDMRLLRYYKNIWLNYKILYWEPINSDFLSKYATIASSLFKEPIQPLPSTDHLLTDLIETSFTCFAQFVSNKQYHQTNANLNLLEKRWTIFISKQLPLLMLEHTSKNPQIASKALENIDDKVTKAIKTYYSQIDDLKSTNEDLFDDYPTTSLDIRHDFIKSLVMLNLSPPSLINDYLRESELIDPKTLTTTDDLLVTNPQGIQENIHDIPTFLLNSINALELEMINGNNNDNNNTDNISSINNGIYQLFMNFDTIAPTKQRQLSEAILSLLNDSVDKGNYTIITKLCALLSFNFNHSLTTILSFTNPQSFLECLMNFVDISWKDPTTVKSEDNEDSGYASNNISLSFSWSLLLIITISQTYDVKLTKVALTSPSLSTVNSFSINFLSKLSTLPDAYILDDSKSLSPELLTQSYKLVQRWMYDLFVNGSISDNLSQTTEPRQLATLLPFILKQVLLAIELGAINDNSNILGGFEYFLQPFMMIGLIKTVYWLEQYLAVLKTGTYSDELIQNIFVLLNSIFNPGTLNEDSRSFHNAVLRLNAVPLLKVLRKFRVQTQSNYNVYSSANGGYPALESLIRKLVSVLNISPIYNTDPRIVSSENMYSQQKPLGYGKLLILDENPINKIMTNQINSFWNLHSSTYYNLDYLSELINLISPEKFFTDVLQTLIYKSKTYGVPVARNKMSTKESEHVLDYCFYFLVLHDVETQIEAVRLSQLMAEENQQVDGRPLKKETVAKKETIIPKAETTQDDDFDMLFGENDTSTHDPEEDLQIITIEHAVNEFNDIATLKNDSFAILIHEMKVSRERAFKEGAVSREEYEKVCKYHKKYLSMLKTCVF